MPSRALCVYEPICYAECSDLRGVLMTRKMSDAEAKRTPLNLRTTAELRGKLDGAASENGRSITQEVERRLEQSFDRPKDPLPGIFSEEVRSYLRSSPAAARLVEAIADTFMHITRAAKERDRDEVEVRTAFCSALDDAKFDLLWRGEADRLPLEGPKPEPGTRRLDLPPAILGHTIADGRIKWLGMWAEEGVYLDKLEGRITDAYSGRGQVTLFGPTPEQVEEQRAQIDEQSKFALAKGDVQFMTPVELKGVKVTPRTYQMQDDDHTSANLRRPQSLKELKA